MFSLVFATLSCEAAIIYTNPDDVQVFGVITLPPLEPVGVDLDLDGVFDFEFTRIGGQFGVDLVPLNGNRIIAVSELPPDIGNFLVPLQQGFLIGPNIDGPSIWIDGAAHVSACVNIGCIGLFHGLTAYIGTEFQIDGEIHFGWMQFADSSNFAGGLLLDFAYESTPGLGIEAGVIPEPSTFSMMLLGIIVFSISGGMLTDDRKDCAKS